MPLDPSPLGQFIINLPWFSLAVFILFVVMLLGESPIGIFFSIALNLIAGILLGIFTIALALLYLSKNRHRLDEIFSTKFEESEKPYWDLGDEEDSK